MVKRIKSPLKMANGVQVRTLEELRENFDLEKVLGYFIDGRLQRWLNERYYEIEAEEVSNLLRNDVNLKRKICDILKVQYEITEDIDIEEIEQRTERINKLKQFTDNKEIFDNIDNVAFNQEELAELLDEDKAIIYLCEGEYSIPLSKKNIKYIGFSSNVPTIKIASKNDVDLSEYNIVCENLNVISTYGTKVIANKEKFKNNGANKNVADFDQLSNGEIIEKALEYYHGRDREKDFIKYFQILQIAVDKDSAQASCLTGDCYLNGIGVEENLQKGFECYKKSALQGYAEAYKKLADCYYKGTGTKQDLNLAMQYYKKAIDGGVESAKENYKCCEFKYLETKAQTGDIDAQAELGSCYYSGSGTALNYSKAFEYFQKASRQGHPGATRNLAICYMFGYGVSKSIYTARSMMSRAISLGDESAKYLIDSIR